MFQFPFVSVVRQTKQLCSLLDFQGFKEDSNKFVIKELTIVSTEGSFLQRWIVRSPFPLCNLDIRTRKQCFWNIRNHNGIEWSDGDITIKDLHHQLSSILEDFIVHVKGLELYPSLKGSHTSSVYCFCHSFCRS